MEQIPEHRKEAVLDVSLTGPTAAVKDSYLEAVKEFQAEGEWEDKDINALSESFDAYVEKVRQRALGDDFYKGRVPNIEFWLTEGEDVYIGSLRVRPQLTESLRRIGGNIGYEVRPSRRGQGYGTKMLSLGLTKARELGLKEVLLTCNEENTASRKTIEANGGKLQECTTIEEWSVPICRYKITL